MKAAILEQAGKPLVVKEVPRPTVEEGWILLRVKACGVCHTDLHLADGTLRSFGYDPFPIVPGHEVAGVVEEVGDGVTSLQLGDRVGVYWSITCGHCAYCQAGDEQVCTSITNDWQALGLTINGGYAEYVTVPADFAVPLPAELEFADTAPMFCAGLTAYAAFKNAGLQSGDRVAVLGVGGLGHLAIQIAKAMGAEVIALTSTGAKEDLALELGADAVIRGDQGNVGEMLKESGGADIVLATTLDFQTVRDVMKGILPLGTLVLCGLMPGRLPLDPRVFVMTQQTVKGNFLGSRNDLGELLRLAAQHHIRPMVETYSLDDAEAVHEQLRKNNVRFRAVLVPE